MYIGINLVEICSDKIIRLLEKLPHIRASCIWIFYILSIRFNLLCIVKPSLKIGRRGSHCERPFGIRGFILEDWGNFKFVVASAKHGAVVVPMLPGAGWVILLCFCSWSKRENLGYYF